MLKLNKDFHKKKEKVFNRIKKSFNLEKINKKLSKFYELEFNDFIQEIEKQTKKKISLKEQDEWEDYFNDYKKDLLKLKDETNGGKEEVQGVWREITPFRNLLRQAWNYAMPQSELPTLWQTGILKEAGNGNHN